MDCIYVPPFRSKITSPRTQSYTDGRGDLRGCNLPIQRWPLHPNSCGLCDKVLVLSVSRELHILKGKMSPTASQKMLRSCFGIKWRDDAAMPSSTHSRHMPSFPDLLAFGSALFPCFSHCLPVCLSVIIHCIIVQPLVQTDSHRNICDRWLFRLDTHINTQKKNLPNRPEKQTHHSQPVPLLSSYLKLVLHLPTFHAILKSQAKFRSLNKSFRLVLKLMPAKTWF